MKFFRKHVITEEIEPTTKTKIHKSVLPNYECCGIDFHKMMVGFSNGEIYIDGSWQYFAK